MAKKSGMMALRRTFFPSTRTLVYPLGCKLPAMLPFLTPPRLTFQIRLPSRYSNSSLNLSCVIILKNLQGWLRMAYTPLSSALYAVGRAVTRNLFSTLSDNADNLNTRLTSVEASASKILFYDGHIAAAGDYSSMTGALFHRVQAGIDITDCKIVLYDKGAVSSGTLELDVQKSSSLDFASSVSVFTTKPSLDLSVAASYSESSNAVLDNTNKSLSEGDYIRIDVTALPSGLGKLFVYLIGEAS